MKNKLNLIKEKINDLLIYLRDHFLIGIFFVSFIVGIFTLSFLKAALTFMACWGIIILFVMFREIYWFLKKLKS